MSNREPILGRVGCSITLAYRSFFFFFHALNRLRENRHRSMNGINSNNIDVWLYGVRMRMGRNRWGEEKRGEERKKRLMRFTFFVSPIFDELLGLAAHWPVHSLSYLLHVGQACFSSSSPPPEAVTSPARRGGCHHFFHRNLLDLPQFSDVNSIAQKGGKGKRGGNDVIEFVYKYFSKCFPFFLFPLDSQKTSRTCVSSLS